MGNANAALGMLAFLASVALVSCEQSTPSQCGETFCLTGSDFGELRKSPPRSDFDFYQTEFRGVAVGIYEGRFPTLPERENQFEGLAGVVWNYGCLNEACSIWVVEAADGTGDHVVISVPNGKGQILEEVAMAVTRSNSGGSIL